MKAKDLVGIVGLLSLISCNRSSYDSSYQLTNSSNLGSMKGNNVVVYGFPGTVGNNPQEYRNKFFVLSEGEDTFHILNKINHSGVCSDEYSKMIHALENEVLDKDKERVKVSGTVLSSNSIEADLVEIEGKQYSLCE